MYVQGIPFHTRTAGTIAAAVTRPRCQLLTEPIRDCVFLPSFWRIGGVLIYCYEARVIVLPSALSGQQPLVRLEWDVATHVALGVGITPVSL